MDIISRNLIPIDISPSALPQTKGVFLRASCLCCIPHQILFISNNVLLIPALELRPRFFPDPISS